MSPETNRQRGTITEPPITDQDQGIYAPYNFVPLANWTWRPDWRNLASHDVPLSEGYSGTLHLTVEACTPLLVGNGSINGVIEFHKDQANQCCIPGSSIKGMIRNVVEISSFSRMQIVTDRRIAYRKEPGEDVLNFSGWLQFNSEPRTWELHPVEHYKVRFEEIKTYGKSLSRCLSFDSSATAFTKYHLFNRVLKVSFSIDSHSEQVTRATKLAASGAEADHGAQADRKQGYLVFTGYIQTKLQEHVFLPPRSDQLSVGPGVFESFRYSHQTLLDESKDNTLKELMRLYDDGHLPGIPVFYKVENKRVSEMALAQIGRRLCEHSVHDLIKSVSPLKQSVQDANPSSWHLDVLNDELSTVDSMYDMAELLFGAMRKGGKSLRGRVSFDDMYPCSSIQPTLAGDCKVILGGPKPSYYPSYLTQQMQPNGQIKNIDVNRPQKDRYPYVTYRINNAGIRGWKRYPVHHPEQFCQPAVPVQGNDAVQTTLKPLATGVRFAGKIRFHNLHPAEIGALVWAITFGEGNHANESKFRHSLGMAKSMGFGQVKLEIRVDTIVANDPSKFGVNLEKFLNESQDVFVKKVSESYQEFCTGKWSESPQIVELLAMADPERAQEHQLEHMPLADFALKKRGNNHHTRRPGGWALMSYSKKIYPNPSPIKKILGLMTPEMYVETIEKTRRKAEEAAQKKHEEDEKAQALSQQEAVRLSSMSVCLKSRIKELEQCLNHPDDKARLISELIKNCTTDDRLNQNEREVLAKEISRECYGFLQVTHSKKLKERKGLINGLRDKAD